MTIYVMARSPGAALNMFLKGEYYKTIEDAERDLEQFGKEWEKIFEIDIPINEV